MKDKNIVNKLKIEFDKLLRKTLDVPIVALITDSNFKIVSVSNNKRQKTYKICSHAEINVINKIFKKNKSKNLKGYILYSIMEPCKMCVGAIEQTGLNEVYYFVNNNKFGSSALFNERIKSEKINTEDSIYFEEKIKEFFKKLR